MAKKDRFEHLMYSWIAIGAKPLRFSVWSQQDLPPESAHIHAHDDMTRSPELAGAKVEKRPRNVARHDLIKFDDQTE
ncbi:hypothetical protein TWF191_009360 [Orbilia oligospora]|uniref:Uncharacterized protein n=1 Tax=Orbilia oligospora TaxID=2813651 RepID=A0A7C8QMS8_ORBOL|nr:hypothetical protein TWF191_009360 [Orbilia oligospora]